MTIQDSRSFTIHADPAAASAKVEAALAEAGLTVQERSGDEISAKGGNLFAYRMLGLLSRSEQHLPVAVQLHLAVNGEDTTVEVTVQERQGPGVNTHWMDEDFQAACTGTLDRLAAQLGE